MKKIINTIYKQAGLLLVVAAAVSAFIEPSKTPLSILAGGVLALANLKGLSWGLGGLEESGRSAGRLVVLSFLRLGLLFIVLAIFAVMKLVNMIGLLIGFTLVFIILLKEGTAISSKMMEEDSNGGQGN